MTDDPTSKNEFETAQLRAAAKADGPATTTFPPSHASAPPVIEGYRILELINEGGMGAVYKAEQREPIHRIVAIKIIKHGLDTGEIVARFESERQALARMDHPHIAKVFAAGATPTGRPYFVMEYVPGKPITAFADDNKLSLRQRLELFWQACDAIAHAHTKAVIHRDIKAGNVLAYLRDAKPTVKVIDFGVAKALTTDRLTDRTFNTEIGHVIGTYDTMSPEQADGSPDIDTRTDVYSLGVLLYELLTGFRPFDRNTLAKAAQEEVKRIIREVEPPRPSTRLSQARQTGDGVRIATARQTHFESLTRALRGELEWIPLKAMRKERDRRYDSVLQLADDVRNYLEDRPLIAGPETTSYKVKKFASRHRAGVTATAAAIMAVVVGSCLYVHGIKTAQARATAALAQAEEERQTTAAVSDFLNTMLTSAGPSVSQGRDASLLKDLLDTAARNAGALVDRPVVQATVMLTLGQTYNEIGRTDLARPQLQRAREILSARFGPADRRVLKAGLELVACDRINSNYAQAEGTAQDLLNRARAAYGADDRLALLAMESLALTLEVDAKAAEAAPIFREILERRRRKLGDDDRESIMALHNLAFALAELGDWRGAEPVARDALARRSRVLGELHPDTIATLQLLASIQLRQGQMDAARTTFTDFHDRCRKVYGDENLFTSLAVAELARMSFYAGKLDEGTAMMRQALAVRKKLGLDDEMQTLQMTDDLANLELRAGNVTNAETLVREAMDRRARKLGPDHPNTLNSVSMLAMITARKGGAENLAEAASLGRRALDGARKSLGSAHRITVGYMNLLGDILLMQGKIDDALVVYKELFELAPQSGSMPADISMYLSSYGLALAKAERFADAIEPLKLAERKSADAAAGSRWHRQTLNELIKALEATGKGGEAEVYRQKLQSLPATQRSVPPPVSRP